MAVDTEHVPQENIIKIKKPHSIVLKCLDKLTKDNEKNRLKASAALIRHLIANSENGEQEAKYTLTRLIRGLGSTKSISKVGYYTTLTALLKLCCHDLQEIFGIVEKELRTSGNNSKSENADILTGHVLLCGALIRSGTFQKASEEDSKKIIEMLINATKKRSYLGVLGYKFLVESFSEIEDSVFVSIILPLVKPELSKPLSDLSLDHLYFLLEAFEKYPKVVNSKFLKSTIQCEKIVAEENIRSIARILMGVVPVEHVLSHPVYQVACTAICTTPHILIFIKEIDEYLSKPTQMSHHAATLLLYLIVENTKDPSILPQILTPNFTQQTIRHFQTLTSKNSDDLQANIYTLFDLITTKLKPDEVTDKLRIDVIKRMLFPPGQFDFERITRSKIIQQITATLGTEGVKELAQIYKDVINGQKDAYLAHRVYATNLFAKLFLHPKMKEDNEWKLEQMKLILTMGLFKSKAGIKPELRNTLKDTFYRGLRSKWGKLEDLRNALSHLVHYLDEEIEKKRSELYKPISDDNYELWKRTIQIIGKLEAKSKKKNHLNPVFHTLFLHMGLQLFDDAKLASDSLSELFACYEKGKVKNTDEDFEWIEVVVDLFMNLLSRDSSLLRSVIGCVFPYLCKDLTPTAIHQILAVLDPKSDTNPLSEAMEVDSEDSDDENSETESKNETSDEEDDESEEDDKEEDDGYKETNSDKLRQAVQAALGDEAALTDTESIDLDDMSDTEGDRLNVALGKAFKQHRSNLGKKRKKQNKEDQQLMHFRARILDLIEMYLDSDVSMIICLEIMLPLLELLEFTIRDSHQISLQDRVKYCLKKITSLKNFASFEDVTEELLHNFLKSLLEKGNKNVIIVQETNDKIADCSIFILKCAKAANIKTKSFQKTLKEALENYFTKRDCPIIFILFKNMLQLSWKENVKFVPNLFEYAFQTDVRLFKRNQALELLRLFYTNQRLLSANQEKFSKTLAKVESDIEEKVSTVFNDVQNLREKYLATLFNLLLNIKNSPVKTETINWENLGETICNFRTGVQLTKDSKIAFNRLFRALKITKPIKMKQNLIRFRIGNEEENNEKVETKKEKKKKTKGNNDQKKLKKESQIKRMENLSEGFENLPFSNSDFTEVKEELEPEKSKDKNKKKIKEQKNLNGKSESSDDEDVSNEPSSDDEEEENSDHSEENTLVGNGVEGESSEEMDVESDASGDSDAQSDLESPVIKHERVNIPQFGGTKKLNNYSPTNKRKNKQSENKSNKKQKNK